MFMKLLHSEDLEESKGASLQSDDGLPTKMFADVQLLATTGDAVSGDMSAERFFLSRAST